MQAVRAPTRASAPRPPRMSLADRISALEEADSGESSDIRGMGAAPPTAAAARFRSGPVARGAFNSDQKMKTDTGSSSGGVEFPLYNPPAKVREAIAARNQRGLKLSHVRVKAGRNNGVRLETEEGVGLNPLPGSRNKRSASVAGLLNASGDGPDEDLELNDILEDMSEQKASRSRRGSLSSGGNEDIGDFGVATSMVRIRASRGVTMNIAPTLHLLGGSSAVGAAVASKRMKLTHERVQAGMTESQISGGPLVASNQLNSYSLNTEMGATGWPDVTGRAPDVPFGQSSGLVTQGGDSMSSQATKHSFPLMHPRDAAKLELAAIKADKQVYRGTYPRTDPMDLMKYWLRPFMPTFCDSLRHCGELAGAEHKTAAVIAVNALNFALIENAREAEISGKQPYTLTDILSRYGTVLGIIHSLDTSPLNDTQPPGVVGLHLHGFAQPMPHLWDWNKYSHIPNMKLYLGFFWVNVKHPEYRKRLCTIDADGLALGSGGADADELPHPNPCKWDQNDLCCYQVVPMLASSYLIHDNAKQCWYRRMTEEEILVANLEALDLEADSKPSSSPSSSSASVPSAPVTGYSSAMEDGDTPPPSGASSSMDIKHDKGKQGTTAGASEADEDEKSQSRVQQSQRGSGKSSVRSKSKRRGAAAAAAASAKEAKVAADAAAANDPSVSVAAVVSVDPPNTERKRKDAEPANARWESRTELPGVRMVKTSKPGYVMPFGTTGKINKQTATKHSLGYIMSAIAFADWQDREFAAKKLNKLATIQTHIGLGIVQHPSLPYHCERPMPPVRREEL